ncbi:hypothetical protein KFK14_14205 [Sphingobium phenoxybenzoativorans]|uniref:Uncharacterized protein n=1 Tax=Sphingobium phenoxybenzoativorans TaxID=1592790 RepID=A0A975PZZ0_9SPHN|nr:hypothetical protein [Sphingobium phenoxybenzoativorans]QUT04239.1 hypothetical protein KFK14_14205 [Sphingobium phenoxybenzoativorans]
MAASLFADVPFRAKIIGGAIIVVPLATLALLGAIFLRPAPIEQRLVWGCYTADNAPPISVEESKIRIVDGTRRSLSYIAEPCKEGYRLTVHPALILKASEGGRYSFEQGRGIGYFWPLLSEASDNPRKVHSPEDFGGRIDIAAEGRSAIYVRSKDGNNCG